MESLHSQLELLKQKNVKVLRLLCKSILKPHNGSSHAQKHHHEQSVDLLRNPGDQLCCLKDHLIRVAALDCVSIKQAANAQVVRI